MYYSEEAAILTPLRRMAEVSRRFFYTIVTNYSMQSYNDQDYYDEKTFPNLATVGEDMMFQTGYDYYGSRGPAVVLYPALKQVGGTLELRPIGPTPWGDNENTGYLNQTLENLDFLSSLEKVGGIRIHDHGKLASYEAIKKAILTCPEEKWSVENNLYNPTYKQLVEDQQWIKPAIQE